MEAKGNIAEEPGSVRERFIASTIRELRYNASKAGSWLAIDASMLIVCVALFYANRLFLINLIVASAPDTLFSYLATSHLNDFIGGFAFMCYTNLLLDLVKPEARFKKLAAILIFIALCGLFWEYIAPIFIEGSTSDPLDVVAYVLGGLIYWIMTKALTAISPSSIDEVRH